MRKRFIKHRSTSSVVQQMNVVNAKQLMSDYLAGKPVDINSGNTNASYDFPDGEIDWNKDLMQGFNNKMEQYMNRSKIVEHLRPPKPDSPVDPPTDPPVDLSTDPPVDPSNE